MNASSAKIRKFVVISLSCLLFSSICQANTALVPVSKGEGWEAAFHRKFIEETRDKDIDILFLGDSITQYWKDPTRGLPVWEKEFAHLKTANFGINGDRIQHVLWRLQNGEGSGFYPKVVVLLLGTNNTTPRNTTEEVLAGLKAVVAELRKGFPNSKILLLGILPRGKKDDPKRGQIAEINRELATWNEPGHVRYLDIGSKFLDDEGEIPTDLMPDGLHPNGKGYEIFAEAIREPIRELMANPAN